MGVARFDMDHGILAPDQRHYSARQMYSEIRGLVGKIVFDHPNAQISYKSVRAHLFAQYVPRLRNDPQNGLRLPSPAKPEYIQLLSMMPRNRLC